MIDLLRKLFPIKKWQVIIIVSVLLISKTFTFFDSNIDLIENYLLNDDNLIEQVGEITRVNIRNEHVKYDMEKKFL